MTKGGVFPFWGTESPIQCRPSKVNCLYKRMLISYIGSGASTICTLWLKLRTFWWFSIECCIICSACCIIVIRGKIMVYFVISLLLIILGAWHCSNFLFHPVRAYFICLWILSSRCLRSEVWPFCLGNLLVLSNAWMLSKFLLF